MHACTGLQSDHSGDEAHEGAVEVTGIVYPGEATFKLAGYLDRLLSWTVWLY